MKMNKQILFFLALAISIEAQALKFCAPAIVEFAARNLLTYTSAFSFILPPQSKRFLIGSLVKFESGPQVLALGGLRSQHPQIECALNSFRLQNRHYGPFSYQWIGEIALENPLKRQAIGRVVAANEISGYFFRSLKAKGVTNDVTHLEKALIRLGGLATPEAVFSPFTGDHHLFPQIIEAKAEFDQLQSEGLIPAKENFRHYINNLGAGLFYKTRMHFTNHKEFPSPQSKLAGLVSFFKRPLSFRVYQLYLDFIENDGLEVENIQQLRSVVTRAMKGEKVLDQEVLALSRMLNDQAAALKFILSHDNLVISIDLLRIPR